MSTVTISFEDGVLRVTMDRPDELNALNRAMIDKLTATFEDADDRDDVRCLVLSGADGVFCAGGDIEAMERRLEEMSAADYRESLRSGAQRMARTLYELSVPTVACVERAAVGGGANLAFACDIVVATEDATFGEVFRNVGLVADTGGSYLLPLAVGLHRAKELFYTGRTFDGREAAEFGLVNHAVPASEFERRCESLIEEIASGPTTSLVLAKELLNEAATTDFETALRAEADVQAVAYTTRDHRAAVKAFVDDEEPSFEGE